MNSFLGWFVAIMLAIVIFGVVNEKILQLPIPIAMMILALGLSVLLVISGNIGLVDTSHTVFRSLGSIDFDDFLTNGILCFMLFAGSSHIKIDSIVKNAKPIALLSILKTVVAVIVYGGLFYLVSLFFHLGINFITCCLLGCILAPTDPIAATGLLSKLGISEDVMTIMEGESLFNDGIGVTCFIIVSNFIVQSTSENGFEIMIKEVFGALAVALLLSFILFKLMQRVKSPIYHIVSVF